MARLLVTFYGEGLDWDDYLRNSGLTLTEDAWIQYEDDRWWEADAEEWWEAAWRASVEC